MNDIAYLKTVASVISELDESKKKKSSSRHLRRSAVCKVIEDRSCKAMIKYTI
jgi:hypothetical protein